MAKRTPEKTARRPNRWFLKLCLATLMLVIGWTIYLDAQVRFKFEGKRWSLPAQVLARPLELYEGQALNLDNFEQELLLLEYAKDGRLARPGTYLKSSNTMRVFRRAHDTVDGRQNALLLDVRIEGDVVQAIRVDGQVVQGIFTIEPFKIGGIYPRSKEERQLVAYDDVPAGLISALLATEDRHYFEHYGISPTSIARAMLANVKAGKVVQGGSTITQQLVKNFYLTRERSIVRKLNEAAMSLLLEFHYSKEDILETYINDIYLGQSGSTAIHGFAMASRFYFAKDLQDLQLQELSLLVAILKGPSYYDPRRRPARALERRNLVLRLMNEDNWITKTQLDLTKTLSLGVTLKPSFQSNKYPAFIDLVRRQLSRDYKDEDLSSDGLRIYTTLDPQLQRNLEHVVAKEIKRLDRVQQNRAEPLQTGAIVTAVGTGEILAILGDRDPRYQGFNRALDAERAVGSLIKPAIYLTALEQSNRYHLPSAISDAPFVIEFENGERWSPSNFDDDSHGDVALVEALARSHNIAAARLGLELGLENVKDMLRRLGVTQELNPYPSLLLGAQAMTPIEVAKFYQTIASNGFNMPLRAIREVADHSGKLLSRYGFEVKQVISPQASYLLQSAMQETMRNGTGKSAYRVMPKQLVTAGKTGTTNDYRDSWFAGFSGDYLGVFWLGNDNNQPTGLTGGSGALRLWSGFMASVPQYPLAPPRPSGVSVRWFDQSTWKETSENCSNAQPLPIWGDNVVFETQSCSSTSNTIKSWIRSWLD